MVPKAFYALTLMTALAGLGASAQTAFKTCDPLAYEKCFSPSQSSRFRYPSEPFVLLQKDPSAKAAVLVHGLTDSPYAMKDIAWFLYQKGYDVVVPLLAGHGTDVTDLFDVSEQQWKADLKKTLQMVKNRNSQARVVLGGFSTGGALVINEALHKHHDYALAGLMLFSPAIETASKYTWATCIERFVKPYAAYGDWPENEPWRYNRMPANAVCQLSELIAENRGRAKDIHVPTFVVFSNSDKTADPQATLSYAESIPNKVIDAIDEELIEHSDVPLRKNDFNGRLNPYFDDEMTKLESFLTSLEQLALLP